MTQHQRGEHTPELSHCRVQYEYSSTGKVLTFIMLFLGEMGEIGHDFSLGVSESALQSKSPIMSSLSASLSVCETEVL